MVILRPVRYLSTRLSVVWVLWHSRGLNLWDNVVFMVHVDPFLALVKTSGSLS